MFLHALLLNLPLKNVVLHFQWHRWFYCSALTSYINISFEQANVAVVKHMQIFKYVFQVF